MSARNSCNTYFKIVGKFNPDEVSELLISPLKKLGKLEICDAMARCTILLYGKSEDARNMMSKLKIK